MDVGVKLLVAVFHVASVFVQGKVLGRRRLELTGASKAAAIRTMRAQNIGIRRIAGELRVGAGTVLRLTAAAA